MQGFKTCIYPLVSFWMWQLYQQMLPFFFSVINFNSFHLIRQIQHLMRAELLAITSGTATNSCIHVILQGGHSGEHYCLDFSGWRKRKTFLQSVRNCAALPSPSGEGGRKHEPAPLTELSHPFSLSNAHQHGDTHTWHEDRAYTHTHARTHARHRLETAAWTHLCSSAAPCDGTTLDTERWVLAVFCVLLNQFIKSH